MSSSNSRATATITDANLRLGGVLLLSGLHASWELEPGGDDEGCFLRASTATAAARWTLALGTLPEVQRFTCTARYEPFWMKPHAGTDPTTVPVETQWLLLELKDGRVAVLVPLVDGAVRASLLGKEGQLRLVVESGDPRVLCREALALYCAVGRDPYQLMRVAAQAVRRRLPRARLCSEKPLPAFADLFGWCTWDAFYQEVSMEKVREGLESLHQAGVPPRMMILDDGWQSERTMPSGERRLTGFAANAKFPGDLRPTVRMAKERYGIEQFLVWHAFHGYWAGVDGEALPGYDVQEVARAYSPGILAGNPNYNLEWWGALVGLVPPKSIHRFFHDYHRHLRSQGVDGVKVDNQSATEGLAAGSGGRVHLMECYHEALEASVALHVGGQVFNCMSCTNEMFYCTEASTLTRTSTDFWPNLPASHGAHLYTNAQVSMWFGEFIWPDWDMFQSGHAMGAFHAAGRAVSGAPVYVSDKPGAHDAGVLRTLVLSDGTTARACEPGRPTRDCLFRDVTREEVLLKIASRNRHGAVVGAFNARHSAPPAQAAALRGTLAPIDVPGIAGTRFAVYAQRSRSMAILELSESLQLELPELASEVFTIVPLEDGVAPIGLAGLLNCSAALAEVRRLPGELVVELRDGGEFVICCRRPPREVLVDGHPASASFDQAMTLRVQLPRPGRQVVVSRW